MDQSGKLMFVSVFVSFSFRDLYRFLWLLDMHVCA